MSKIRRDELFNAALIIFGTVFVAALTWQVLVSNHARNVERDKVLFSNCKKVKEYGILTRKFVCEEPTHE